MEKLLSESRTGVVDEYSNLPKALGREIIVSEIQSELPKGRVGLTTLYDILLRIRPISSAEKARRV